MKRILISGLLVWAMISGMALAGGHKADPEKEKAAINTLVDGFHEAASLADKDRYLGYFTKDGVFMGTDDWERWPMEPDLKAYVAERFKGGTGWTYKSIERNIAFSHDGHVGWFDEITKSAKWGLFRGTGVVLKQDGVWKIAHYSMSVLVPNDAWVAVSDLNKAAVKRREAEKK